MISRVTPQAQSFQKVSFKGQKNNQKKRIYPAVASVVVPGSGQMMNGEFKKGLSILGIYTALGTGIQALGSQVHRTVSSIRANPKAVISEAQKNAVAIKSIGAVIGIFTLAGLTAYSAINAYKHSTDDKTSGKNTLQSIASYFLPGSGQVMNGEMKKGLAFAAGAIGLTLLNAKNVFNFNMKAVKAGGVAATCLALYAAVDAYRHSKAVK